MLVCFFLSTITYFKRGYSAVRELHTNYSIIASVCIFIISLWNKRHLYYVSEIKKIICQGKLKWKVFFSFITNVAPFLSFDCVDIYVYPCKVTASLHWKSGQNRRRTDRHMDRHREPAYKGSVLQFRLQEHENAESRLKRQCAMQYPLIIATYTYLRVSHRLPRL